MADNSIPPGEDKTAESEFIKDMLGDLAPDGQLSPGTNDKPLTALMAVPDNLRILPQRLNFGGPVPAPKRPGAVADLIAHLLADDEGVHLKHWRDQWHIWRQDRTGGRYQPLGGSDNKYAVPDMVRSVLEHAKIKIDNDVKPWDPNSRSVKEVTEALAAFSRPDETMVSGSWIGPDAEDRESETPGSEVTCVANGLLWCPTYGGVSARRLLPHTPAFFTTASVAVGYDPDAECTRWMQFLNELWPDDEDSQKLLQEWFGYVLARSTSLHKILALVGTRRCGKSTIAWVLEQLLGGVPQVDHPTMARLAEPFGLAPMLGKRLAIVGDARLGKSDAAIVEKLLMISGEDPVTVNRKNREEISAKLDTRIMIVSNSMPDLKDTTGALASRFLPLRIRIEGFYGREDRFLKRVLGSELPGILRWALEGADRLWANGGRFTIGDHTKEAMEEVEREGSKVKAFAMDALVFDPESTAVKNDVFEAWTLWCADNGYHPTGKNVFVRDLRDAYPGRVDLIKLPPSEGRRPALKGVRLA